MTQLAIRWNKLTPKCLPPTAERFLLWLGLDDSDGGFPAVARLLKDRDGTPYICFHSADDTWKIFFKCEWRGMMWVEIPRPDKAQKKWNKEQEIIRKNAEKRS